MPLTVTGISHHNAPVAIRELVALGRETPGEAAARLKDDLETEEVVVIGTCNRSEIYTFGPERSAVRVMSRLAAARHVDTDKIEPYLFQHRNADAVRHLFRVATGLDSQVLGEPQILGQVKEAWRQSSKTESLGPVLDRLFQRAFQAAKTARSETGVGEHPVSVAYTATILARQLFGDLGRQRVLMVGAGEMIERCGQHFAQHGVNAMTFANRSVERAEGLAERHGGSALPLDALADALGAADIVISCTASEAPIIDAPMVRKAIRVRRHRPMFIVDIAVPRDVDPSVAELPDAYLYTIDDLQGVVDDHMAERRRAADAAEQLIDAAVDDFIRWMHSARARESLVRLRRRYHDEGDEVAARALRQIEQGAAPEEVLPQMVRTLANRFLHAPTQRLLQAGEDGDRDMLEAVARLFSDDEDRS